MGKPSKRKSTTRTKTKNKRKSKRRVGDNAPAVGEWKVLCEDPFGNLVKVNFPPTLRYFRGEEAGPSWGVP
jgi:hypothetical protein